MKEKILIHVCCGPCAIMPVKIFEKDFEPVGFWFNPNIQPYAEHQKRVQAAGYVFSRLAKDIVWDLSYDVASWFSEVIPEITEGKNRCGKCYLMRLEKTAKFARENNFRHFSTTMLVSPHQNIGMIEKAGMQISVRYGLQFHSDNFREHYRESRPYVKQWQVYHQNYCGCIFSEVERAGLNGKI